MKKIYIKIALLCCFISNNLFAQSFVSEIEKEVFIEYSQDSLNYNFLKSLSAIDSTLTTDNYLKYKNLLDNFINSFPDKELKDNREKKRVKKIYSLIHTRFLQKYDNKAIFTDIFKNGYYNCVSASALYAYVFDKIDIPYHVKELPSHVYLIAYPNSLKIHLETTAPGAYGFYSPNESELKKIVNELVDHKLVSKSELLQKGYNQIYQDYFYGKEFVSKASLIGMQYFNKSILDFENKNYKSAYSNISKSIKFYKSPLSNKLSKQLTLLNLSEIKITTLEDLDLVNNTLSILEYKKDIDNYNVRELLYRITNNNDNEFILKAAIKFESIKDVELKEFILIDLYDYLSRSEAEKRNFKKAINYSDKLLELNPDNKRAIEVLSYCIPAKISVMPFNEATLTEMEQYIEKYQFLNGDKRTDTTLAILYGQMAQTKFLERNSEKGLKYLNSFEKIMDKNRENVLIPPQGISQLYLLVGRYYFGLSKFKSALKHFQKGIEYTPNNAELKKMLKWTKQDLK